MKQYIPALVVLAALLSGCGSSHKPGETGHDPGQTGLEYAPDMYVSLPPDPYSQTGYHKYTKDGRHAQAPVPGTIARGKLGYAYPYPNNNDGYERAGKELVNPLVPTAANIAEGKRLFANNCQHCHGEKGDGNGKVAAGGGGKFAGVISYYDDAHKELPVGKMFHSITYGKNLMGSHATQLNPTERWQVILWIKVLQKAAGGAAPSAEAAAAAWNAQPEKDKPQAKK